MERGSLVLSRKPQERIVLGEHIEITVTKVNGRKVWINIRAPKSMTVHRGEVYDRIQAEKAAS